MAGNDRERTCSICKSLFTQGVPKKDKPKEPDRSAEYPKKYEIALKLLGEFANGLTKSRINSRLYDF